MKHLAGKSAILYRRVSTTEQKDTGSSLSSQNEQLIEYCNKNEIVILKDFEEDYSAKNFNRPEFNKLLEFAVKHKTKIDYLLINR